MDLINKSFKNNQTGEIVRIVDSYQNIAITEGKEKIDAKRLTDTRYYTEYIDPKSFFNSPNTYNMFAEKIKNIDLSKIPDSEESRNDTALDIQYPTTVNGLPVSNESAVIYSDPEDEVEELKRKYGATIANSESISRQNEAFNKLLGDDTLPVMQPVVQPIVETIVSENIVQNTPKSNYQVVEDPIISIFKNAKRNIDFSIEISVDGKIPRTDFIEMMEDSYELSIIEYLADEFTANIVKNPHSIRNKIIKEIKKMVYGETLPVENLPENKLEVKEETEQPKENSPVKRKYKKKSINDTGTIS